MGRFIDRSLVTTQASSRAGLVVAAPILGRGCEMGGQQVERVEGGGGGGAEGGGGGRGVCRMRV